MIILTSLADPQLTDLFQKGAVGVLPTDTIYGLVTPARQAASVARLYALKDREQKPGTVIAASIQQLIDLGLDAAILAQLAHLWPNPISVVVPAPESLDYLDQNVGSLAVRIPKDPALQALLLLTGPLVTTSANHPGQTPAGNVGEAQDYFNGAVDFYVDGGDRNNRPPSTVVRLESDGGLKTLRPGAVTLDENGRII